ncbi:hypothetical protein [Streptomyces jumonjinensis]|uniref:Uncharacterized protein n=1 Tax=Streptomyces jumonjinensis TaxID=1945 RepID=A0A646KF05_STRJU|nr:hypothetical protein [Streptomyces jumonjinensis]MQT00869.1 hypothetical protein [Streptomyces jumonjinensis]
MARVRVRIFTCDWPGCTAELRTAYTTERKAKAYVWKRGWLWTADGAEMHFCGAVASSGRRPGHARRILAEHRPALVRLTPPCSGWSVACWCGWSASERPTDSAAPNAAGARTLWARHLTLPRGAGSAAPAAPAA